jgi:hypothetical protein
MNVESLTFFIELLPHVFELNGVNDVSCPCGKIELHQCFANFLIMSDK